MLLVYIYTLYAMRIALEEYCMLFKVTLPMATSEEIEIVW